MFSMNTMEYEYRTMLYARPDKPLTSTCFFRYSEKSEVAYLYFSTPRPALSRWRLSGARQNHSALATARAKLSAMHDASHLPCPTAPTRFFIGTQKAGSSYLYHLLNSHPDVSLAELTEVNFFGSAKARDLSWYCEQFPKGDFQIDVSPTYFKFGERAAAQIKQTYGAAAKQLRFVLFLRNPIDYVHSHYHMQRAQGYFAAHPEAYPELPQTFQEFIERYPAYLDRGRYHATLQQWLRHFSRKQFLIVPFEQFTRQEHAVLRDVCAFWDLRYQPMHASAMSQNRALRFPWLYRLRGLVAKSETLKQLLRKSAAAAWLYRAAAMQPREPLSPELRAQLARVFAEDVSALRALGVDTSLWGDFHG